MGAACLNGSRECRYCGYCAEHHEQEAEFLVECACGERHYPEDMIAGICCEAYLLDDEDLRANAYLYIKLNGLEEDFYCCYVNDSSEDYDPRRVQIEKDKFWGYYDYYTPFQRLLTDYLREDLSLYARWIADKSGRLSLYDIKECVAYFKNIREAA